MDRIVFSLIIMIPTQKILMWESKKNSSGSDLTDFPRDLASYSQAPNPWPGERRVSSPILGIWLRELPLEVRNMFVITIALPDLRIDICEMKFVYEGHRGDGDRSFLRVGCDEI